MKGLLVILIISIASILILVKCFKCYSCVEKGDSFELPYSDSQNVSFLNNSFKKINFLVKKELQLPPSEYCGQVGSQSYQECSGSSSATFQNSNDSLIKIKIYYLTDGSTDGVELPVFKNVIINNRRLIVMKNKSYSPDNGGIVRVLNSITINNKLYNNVVEFSRSADSLIENECGYILYSKSAGIIKFSVKRSEQMEEWLVSENKK